MVPSSVRTWWRCKGGRERIAVGLFIGSLVGWVVTAVLQAVGFPVFEQVMLGISWLALAYTSVNTIMTAQVHDQSDTSSSTDTSGEGDRGDGR